MLHIHVMVNGQLLKQVPADQHHMTISRAQARPIEVMCFFEVIHSQVASFLTIAGTTPWGFLWDGYKFINETKLY